MTVPGIQQSVHLYPLPERGVNLNKNVVELRPEESLETKNCVWRNGVIKRGGTSIFETDEIAMGLPVTGLYRFYFGLGNKQLTAASGDKVVRHDGATWQDIRTGLTSGAQVHMITWGGVQKMYYSNGNDELYSWDGSSDVELIGGSIPSSIIMVLPYQDRLLAIDNTNPGEVTWSDSFSDTPANWKDSSATGVKPDSQLFGMVHHSATNVSAGFEAKVLFAGANGMYLFTATDLRTPSTTGDYTIFPLATNIGCNAPRTMIWTPKGTLYLGIDKIVYLLPFGSASPLPVSKKITSNRTDVEGLENIPSARISSACATYHDGYYKLSVTKEGENFNTVQWWLDIDRLQPDEDGFWGPWYGPMEHSGLGVSVFANQTGNGDSGELMAGESNGANGSLVYQTGRKGVLSDISNSIPIRWRSPFNAFGNPVQSKVVHRTEVEILDTGGDVDFEFSDMTKTLTSTKTLTLGANSFFWDDFFWNEQDWNGDNIIRSEVRVSPAINSRRVSADISHDDANNDFQLYSFSAEVTEQNLTYDKSA